MDEGGATDSQSGQTLDQELEEAYQNAAEAWRQAVGRARGAAIARGVVAVGAAVGGAALIGLAAWQLLATRAVPPSAVALGVAGAAVLLAALRWGLDPRRYENAMLGAGAASASYAVFLYRLAVARELIRRAAAEERPTAARYRDIDQLLHQIDQDTQAALGGKPKSLDDLLNQLT